MDRTIRARLATMMALIYGVQGAWWPLLALHLGDLGISGRRRGLIFATYPLATIATSLGVGALVDRSLPAQRYLSYASGAGAMFLVAVALGWVGGFGFLLPFFLIYWLFSAPSYGIANAIAFRHLPRPVAEFGGVRKWGTVGWMSVGWLVSAAMAGLGSGSGRGAFEAFWVAAALSASLAVFALTLPHTPPLATSGRSTSLGLVLELAKTPGVGLYLAVAFGVSLTTPFVFQTMPTYLESIGLPRAWAATALTLGQWPEVAALAALPRLIRRVGYKGTLALGMAAWLVRFASLAAGPPLWVALAGIPLHGIGIACFTVGGQVFLDSRAPGDRRAGAQATQMLVSTGLGSLAGSLLAGDLVGRFSGNYAAVFLVPCLIQCGLLGLFIAGFRPDAGPPPSSLTGLPIARPAPSRDEPSRDPAESGHYARESADG